MAYMRWMENRSWDRWQVFIEPAIDDPALNVDILIWFLLREARWGGKWFKRFAQGTEAELQGERVGVYRDDNLLKIFLINYRGVPDKSRVCPITPQELVRAIDAWCATIPLGAPNASVYYDGISISMQVDYLE